MYYEQSQEADLETAGDNTEARVNEAAMSLSEELQRQQNLATDELQEIINSLSRERVTNTEQSRNSPPEADVEGHLQAIW